VLFCWRIGELVAKTPKPTIDQVLDYLIREVVIGKGHLKVAMGLAVADPVVLNSSQTFFGSTLAAQLESAQMHVARLYDATHVAVTVEYLLKKAEMLAGTFPNGTASEVRAAIANAKSIVTNLDTTLKSVTLRRNKYLAHLDPAIVVNPAALAQEARLTFPELEKVFDGTAEILNDISVLWRDITPIVDLIGGDDYKSLLQMIAKVKCENFKKYEAEFGPAPFPRPRDCK
jgi:hypothetical protein